VIALVAVLIVLALLLVGLAIWKRPYVKASLNFGRVGFSLEANSDQTDRAKPHS
jgi:hypothetical protein